MWLESKDIQTQQPTHTVEHKRNKAIVMMRRTASPSINIYFIENHCQTNISKGRREKALLLFS